MRVGLLVTFLAMLAVTAYSANLRNYEHEFLSLDSLNPLQIAGLMSGDWVSILPASIQPIARQVLGK